MSLPTPATLQRGSDAYEPARRASLWNTRIPERYPQSIVRAGSEQDVLEAVRLARREASKIGVCSGGHSWAANHLREGGMLIDVGAIDGIHVDPETRTATVGPGALGTELLARLAEHDLFFPVGHCNGVAVGGYLLQGGFGWNGRVHGPACISVEAIDVVSANGELLRADAAQHEELLWAARGAGPGFFGVVTRFHLRLYERPRVIANALYTYPMEVLDELFAWVAQLGPQIARAVELMLLIHRDEAGQPEIALTAPVLAADEEQARAALAPFEQSPVLEHAKLSVPYIEMSFADLFAGSATIYPDACRWATDNMWTHAPVEDLLPGLHRIAETLPGEPSHMLWLNWGPSPARPDMAFSVEDDTYIALYGASREPQLDAETAAWATERMREMEPLSSGIQLADENLGRRPARFVSDENLQRLDAVREAYDPQGLFHPWMGRPWEAQR